VAKPPSDTASPAKTTSVRPASFPDAGRSASACAARPPGTLTRHDCTNTVVTVLSATEAKAHSYILLFTAPVAEGAVPPVKADTKQLLGAFDDTFVRDSDGSWKFKNRQGSLAMTIGG